nr:putative reverse transcriptase domain-containing protein [Tanacetum cinerariifolium]
VWNEEREKSFEELKQRLVSAPVFTLPSGSGGFLIYSDASKKGLGCRLDIEIYVRGQHGYWASLRIEPDLISRIKEAQKEDTVRYSCMEVGISMDFVTGLPQTQRRHDAIWVVVDLLTKSAYFLPIRKDYSVSRLAVIFQQEIVRLHGTPSAIVSDRDPRFASRFWKGLQKAWGTRLKFGTAFHLQTDGQSECTIQTLKDMLRSCALEWTGN